MVKTYETVELVTCKLLGRWPNWRRPWNLGVVLCFCKDFLPNMNIFINLAPIVAFGQFFMYYSFLIRLVWVFWPSIFEEMTKYHLTFAITMFFTYKRIKSLVIKKKKDLKNPFFIYLSKLDKFLQLKYIFVIFTKYNEYHITYNSNKIHLLVKLNYI